MSDVRPFRALRPPAACNRCTCTAAIETDLALRGDLRAAGYLLRRALGRGR